jgi:hypothetical protein
LLPLLLLLPLLKEVLQVELSGPLHTPGELKPERQRLGNDRLGVIARVMAYVAME